MRHPSIPQAQVVGVPDAYMGEEAVAVLQLKEGEALTEVEVRGYCRAGSRATRCRSTCASSRSTRRRQAER